MSDLRKLAEGATPGPWHTHPTHDASGTRIAHFFGKKNGIRVSFAVCAYHHTAAYIAAVDPQTVLALLDRAEAAEAERDRLRGLIDYAVMLHENGEAPPGHELATWDGWYRTVRAALAGDEA